MREVPRAPSKPSPPPAKQAAPDELASGALAQLDAHERGAESTSALPAHALLDRIVLRFVLDEVEHAMLAFLAAAETSVAVSRRLRALSGAPNVSVEAVREVLAHCGFAGVMERPAPRGRLRTHALVHVGDGVTRLPAASDALQIEVGLEPSTQLGAELAELSVLDPCGGARRSCSGSTRKIATVVLLELSGASSDEAIAKLIAVGSSRRVVWWHAQADECDRAPRLRRDVDLEGAVLVVSGQIPIRALLAPPPIAPAAPPLIVILGGELDPTHVDSIAWSGATVRGDAALPRRNESTQREVGIVEREVTASWILRRDRVAAEAARTAPPLGEMDRARMLAQRDADLAPGISRPQPARRRAAGGPRADHRLERARRRSVRACAVVRAHAVGPAAARSRRADPRGRHRAGHPTPAPTPVVSRLRPSRRPLTSREPMLPAASSSPVEEGPRLEISLDAPPDATRACGDAEPGVPSAAHRALAQPRRHENEHGGGRDTPQREERARRASAKPAETLMAQLFGAAWNRNRPIAPPAQSPPSHDRGRGPGGAM